MTKHEQRIDRLEDLSFMLRNHDAIFPQLQFDMGVWKCNSAACAFGSATCWQPFIEQGLGFESLCNDVTLPTYDGWESYSAGAAFFNIEYSESEWLFSPWEYYTVEITADNVADRVDQLIKYYEKLKG